MQLQIALGRADDVPDAMDVPSVEVGSPVARFASQASQCDVSITRRPGRVPRKEDEVGYGDDVYPEPSATDGPMRALTWLENSSHDGWGGHDHTKHLGSLPHVPMRPLRWRKVLHFVEGSMWRAPELRGAYQLGTKLLREWIKAMEHGLEKGRLWHQEVSALQGFRSGKSRLAGLGVKSSVLDPERHYEVPQIYEFRIF